MEEAVLDSEIMKFIQAIANEGGHASRSRLPLNTREQDRARQRARKLGLAEYKSGSWHLTDNGLRLVWPKPTLGSRIEELEKQLAKVTAERDELAARLEAIRLAGMTEARREWELNGNDRH